jgi:hemoglobin
MAGTFIADTAAMSAASNTVQPALLRPPHFEMLGGRDGVAGLVDAFYRHMDTRPDARGIRAMHEPDLAATKAVLVLYLCEWLGGPRDYSASRGHPRLRMRHAGFPIGQAERDAWLACMGAALEDAGAAPALRTELMNAFFKTADWMRNTAPAQASPHPASIITKESS